MWSESETTSSLSRLFKFLQNRIDVVESVHDLLAFFCTYVCIEKKEYNRLSMVVLNFMLTRIFCVAKQISADGNDRHQTRQGVFWSNDI